MFCLVWGVCVDAPHFIFLGVVVPWGSKSGRLRSLPRGWHRIRRVVLERDGFRCCWVRGDTGLMCGAFATDVDHIGDDSDHSLGNLQSLCRFHHARKTSCETASKSRRFRGGSGGVLRAFDALGGG